MAWILLTWYAIFIKLNIIQIIFLIVINILIKSARKRQNLTQKELSLRCNLSQSYLSKLENKKYSNVTIEQVIILSKELKIDPIELAISFIDTNLKENI